MARLYPGIRAKRKAILSGGVAADGLFQGREKTKAQGGGDVKRKSIDEKAIKSYKKL
jgi:hypothetical protein